MSLSSPEEDAATRHARNLGRMANVQIFCVALLVAAASLWLLSDVVLLLFAATLVACQLQGAAAFVARHTGLRYGFALVLVIVAILGAFALAFWLRGPFIVDEGRIVADQIEKQVTEIWQKVGHARWLSSAIDRVKGFIDARSGHISGMAAGFVTDTIGNAGSLLLIIVAAIYLAAAPKQYVNGVVALLPLRWRPRGAEVMRQEGHTLRWWFIGQLIDMTTIGVLTGLGLLFLGVKLYPVLGLIAALCNFVPYIGALAGSVPAIIVGLSQGPRTALYVVALFIVVQSLEGNVTAPLIQRRTVHLPPVVTLLSQTVLGTLFGPLGLILATPIVAAVMQLVRMVYLETILGDDSPKS